MSRSVSIDPVLERGYDVRKLRDDFQEICESWTQRSAETRVNAVTVLDCAYGPETKDKLDLFLCGHSDAPLFVFIHGGYWQRGDKSMYSFVAESFLQSGADVALIGYRLCPDVSMTSIVERTRSALAWLWRHGRQQGICPERINISGHSAGGHLTAMALATDWRGYADDLPEDLVKSGVPMSGLYQLEPLRQTTISHALHLDSSEVMSLSPHNLQPSTTAPILVTLGGAETAQFHWQSDEFVARWSTFKARVNRHAEPGVDHFDLLNRLARKDSQVFEKTFAWLR